MANFALTQGLSKEEVSDWKSQLKKAEARGRFNFTSFPVITSAYLGGHSVQAKICTKVRISVLVKQRIGLMVLADCIDGQVHHFYAHKSPENMGLLGIKANKR